MTHDLKTDPKPFAAVASGAKPFELRKADRPFDKLDLLHLRETSATGDQMAAYPRRFPLRYTGREILARVTYILDGPRYGLTDGWCILGLFLVEVADRPIPADTIRRHDWNATLGDEVMTADIAKRVQAWRDQGPLPRRAGPALKVVESPGKPTLAGLIASGHLTAVEPFPQAAFEIPTFLDAAEVQAGMEAVKGDRASAYQIAVEADEKACPGRRTYPPITAADVERLKREDVRAVGLCHECFGTQVVAGIPCPLCTAKRRR